MFRGYYVFNSKGVFSGKKETITYGYNTSLGVNEAKLC